MFSEKKFNFKKEQKQVRSKTHNIKTGEWKKAFQNWDTLLKEEKENKCQWDGPFTVQRITKYMKLIGKILHYKIFNTY